MLQCERACNTTGLRQMSADENYLDLKAPTNDVYTEVGVAVGSDEYLTLKEVR